jgi:hypothetical protein
MTEGEPLVENRSDKTPVGVAAALARALDEVDPATYYGPPGSTDEQLAASLADLAGSSEADRANVLASLTESRRRALGRYALRASVVALRTRDTRHLQTGLLARALLRQRVADWRDDLVAFAPSYVAAQMLNVPPAILFDGAAVYAVAELADVMRRFGQRRDVTLEAFGWRLVETQDGPTFEQLSWGGAPTGALIGERSWDEVQQRTVQTLREWIARQRDAAE